MIMVPAPVLVKPPVLVIGAVVKVLVPAVSTVNPPVLVVAFTVSVSEVPFARLMFVGDVRVTGVPMV